MDLADRIAIYELCSRFAMTLDCGDAEGVAALFTEDGTYQSIRRASGASNLVALFTTLIADRANPNKAIKNGVHVCGMPIVDGDGTQARALSPYIWVATSRAAEPVPIGTPFTLRLGFEAGQPQVLLAGMYQDDLRKIDGEWRFEFRRALTDVPASSAIPRP
jgi:hypothetical protein